MGRWLETRGFPTPDFRNCLPGGSQTGGLVKTWIWDPISRELDPVSRSREKPENLHSNKFLGDAGAGPDTTLWND